MKQHNQYWINSQPLRQHLQTRPISPFQREVELQCSPRREIPSLLLYPQTKPLRQLCLLTVEASKRAFSIIYRGADYATAQPWLKLTCHFYSGSQTAGKMWGRGVQWQARLPRGWTETPICLLSRQMTAWGPAAFKDCSAVKLPKTHSLLKCSGVKAFNLRKWDR